MAKLLFLTEKFPPDIGGLAQSSARIAGALAELGVEVKLLAWSRHVPAGKLVEQQLENGPANLKIYRQGMYRQWDMTMLATMNALEWLHKENNFEAIWGHYLSKAGFLAVWFAKLYKLKAAVSARGNDIDSEIFPPGDFSRLLFTLQNADLITAVSKNMAEKLVLLSKRNDIVVLPNAVNSKIFKRSSADSSRLKAELKIEADELVLGFAGELREKKGTQFLFEMLPEIRCRVKACLLIIGDLRSTQRPAVQIFAAEHPEDAKRLIITGRLQSAEEVAAYLNICDIFLLPSLLEGMPNSLLEAMACGRLCIASDAGGIPEIIKHGENGFILARAQLNYLATAIEEAMDLAPETRDRICLAAEKTAADSFNLDCELRQLDELMQLLFSKSSYKSQSDALLRSRL